MKIKEEILINQYGQSLVNESEISVHFNNLTKIQQQEYLLNLIELILQSKPKESDIEIAIKSSLLRPTYTPCILLRNGIKYNNLKKIADLPYSERLKSLVLLLNLFKVAYQRRFEKEKNQYSKWWYSDLSNEKNIELILKQYEI
ncbi:DUF5958 family protein [Bacteroides nordii]|uniref:Uncharacterized protein n=1 Tax=Bacteroides nordii CL02T12C05 TaxID=997884 RepID=I9RMZ3_9BACE|nr:DUF5958 family protein [Bacteroides nordii]EIY43868.1 hypothetical protein HMPREF1068_04193 [Bacteroides nordii CL02T12C05]MCG4769797.1 DUF5958 family protein [Bacteroides nordii]